MLSRQTRNDGALATRLGLTAVAALLLAACSATQGPEPTNSAAFRLDRFEEMQRVQQFDECAQEGLTLDTEARSRASSGAFLNSARVLSRCLDDVAQSAEAVPQAKRMRVHALATLNYFKGGDVETARRSFDRFKADYPDRDLCLRNNVSFIESVNVLLGRTEQFRLGQFAVLNVDDDLKREVRRIDYWKSK